MSIMSDFHMYYRNSLIGVRRGDQVLPFYCNGVTASGSENDISRLIYNGAIITDSRGHTEDTQVRQSDIVTSLPEIGYIKPGRNPMWLSYRAVRGNSKGIIRDRLDGDGFVDLTTKIMYSIYNPEFEGRFGQHCCIHQDKVMWKGAQVGRMQGDSQIIIPTKLSYLSDELGRLTSCRVTARR